MHGVGQGLHKEGFGQTWNAFKEAVATGGHRDENLLNDVLLTDDSLGKRSLEFVESIHEGGSGGSIGH